MEEDNIFDQNNANFCPKKTNVLVLDKEKWL